MKKTLPALIAAMILGASAAAPAHAFTPGGTFALTGPFVLRQSMFTFPCTAHLIVNSTSNLVVSASFSGSQFCASIVNMGMSWTTLQNPSAPSFTIQTMAFTTPLGPCPTTAVAGAWSNGGSGSMTIPVTVMSPNCQIVSATLSASPAQTLP